MGQVFVPWTNTLSTKWGKYSSLGRIPSTHGASICNTRVRTNTPTRNLGQVLARGRIVLTRRIELSAIRQIYSYSCGVFKFAHPARLRIDLTNMYSRNPFVEEVVFVPGRIFTPRFLEGMRSMDEYSPDGGTSIRLVVMGGYSSTD